MTELPFQICLENNQTLLNEPGGHPPAATPTLTKTQSTACEKPARF